MNIVTKFIFISFIASMSAYANPSYIPSDLEKFNKTGICINCDLSEAALYSHDNVNLTGAYSGLFHIACALITLKKVLK